MKIESTQIAAASLIAEDARRDASPVEETVGASSSSEPMPYDDLLPCLLLPMAGAY
ncbi:hypothetical protein AWB75_02353 [Caballeronia catudaia]|uniref:Uncharacterized protein n=1 Tax=Caballeronia catudaia TaxID=1777136 RepID=A0A158AKQ8_9BURK|nr:hypothetical protein [Caballeronia catudaia]SAK58438.1 hypothetical protein AWB75_02353 [Caballeronia catudaia]